MLCHERALRTSMSAIFQLAASCHQQISFDGGMLVLLASSEVHVGLCGELYMR